MTELESTKDTTEATPTNGWVDVYVVVSDQNHFRRRVDKPPDEEGLLKLHNEMCRALAPTPTTPLPWDQVVLVTHP